LEGWVIGEVGRVLGKGEGAVAREGLVEEGVRDEGSESGDGNSSG